MILNRGKEAQIMLFIIITSLLLFAGCEAAYRSAINEGDRAIEEEISAGRYDYNLN